MAGLAGWRVFIFADYGNTPIGYQAGISNNNGYFNCFIGSETATHGADYYNVITIGHGTIARADDGIAPMDQK